MHSIISIFLIPPKNESFDILLKLNNSKVRVGNSIIDLE
jgi:hypothetical protein